MVLDNSSQKESFLRNIEPIKDQRKYLLQCKNDIREQLRVTIRKATVDILGMEKAVEPRFRTQGSWSYDTCIQPAFCPPQEMDWDFGVYLPVQIWEENGPPHKMARAYFNLVESCLQDFCKAKGWSLIYGKDTCIRIKVAAWAHIDIPLYAAPEEEFKRITERVALESASLRKSMSYGAYDSAETEEDSDSFYQEWEDLNHIAMATRAGEWKKSDPEAVAKWYRDRVEEYTPQLQRVCRYLKAWRDFHWQEGGPTSVSIMVAVAQCFKHYRGRDDLALENSAKQLSKALLNDIRERGIDNGVEDFNKRISQDDRLDVSNRASALAEAINQARSLAMHQSDQAIKILQKHLGTRIPSDINLISADNGSDEIRSVPAKRVSMPIIQSTSAG